MSVNTCADSIDAPMSTRYRCFIWCFLRRRLCTTSRSVYNRSRHQRAPFRVLQSRGTPALPMAASLTRPFPLQPGIFAPHARLKFFPTVCMLSQKRGERGCADMGTRSTSLFLMARQVRNLWNSRSQHLKRKHASLRARCTPRSLDPRRICGVYSNDTEHPQRSLAERSLTVCFGFSSD